MSSFNIKSTNGISVSETRLIAGSVAEACKKFYPADHSLDAHVILSVERVEFDEETPDTRIEYVCVYDDSKGTRCMEKFKAYKLNHALQQFYEKHNGATLIGIMPTNEMYGRYIVITGNVNLGFEFHGPHLTLDEANEWGDKNYNDWCVSELHWKS